MQERRDVHSERGGDHTCACAGVWTGDDCAEIGPCCSTVSATGCGCCPASRVCGGSCTMHLWVDAAAAAAGVTARVDDVANVAGACGTIVVNL
jgi:hypothetical protein